MSDVLLFSSIMMLVLLFLKVPVFVAVLGGSLVYFIMNPDINSVIFAQQMILGTEKISLLAIPFFVCAGIVMNYTGVTKRIMDFCEVVTSHLPGGLAQVNVMLSTVMGGLSGSNLADAAMEAKMLIPAMTKKHFSLPFSSVVPVKSGVSDAVRAFTASDAAAQSAAFFSALMSIFRVLYGLRRANRASASMSAT